MNRRRHVRALRRRYGRSRLTPDALPYAGHGIMGPSEYKAHLHTLRQVRDAEVRNGRGAPELPGADAPIGGATYMGSIATARAGLVRQSRDGFFVLTPYGREYLAQREGAR